ncbi:MAG: carbohydrate kinase family protein [Kiritimatiellales bacterium]|nr:carbohydrate kinase family protein [Kiritimatiellales bacterium]
MNKKILVTGSVAYDVMLGYDGSFADAIDPAAIDSLSLSFFSPHYARHHGGTGANIAWSLKLLGEDPLLVSSVGKDGREYTSVLDERGIDTSRIEIIEDKVTATAIVGTDSKERQITFFHPGADSHGTWPDLSQDRDDFAYAIVSPRDTNAMVSGMEWCDKFSVPVIFDPGQQIIAFGEDALDRLVRMGSVLIANQYEWDLVKKKLSCDEKSILELVPLVIVTLGDKGLIVIDENGEQKMNACKSVNVVNPTGAGDAFRAGLLKGFVAGWEVIDACKLGAAMGSLAVESEGTLLPAIDIDEVKVRVEQAYKTELPAIG